MREVLEFILNNTLPQDTSYTIDEGRDDIGIIFTVTIPAETRGILIGKSGKNIKAIRDILGIIARRHGEKVFIKVAD